MKILKFDSVGGASGDMILGALLGLGVDRDALVRDLRALGAEHFDITLHPFQSHGITGVQAEVKAEEPHHHHHHHHHDHDHDHHHGEDAHGSAGRLALPMKRRCRVGRTVPVSRMIMMIITIIITPRTAV
jgi:hypothetical protein